MSKVQKWGLVECKTTLKRLGDKPIKHPTLPNEWGVRLILQCDICKSQWNIDKFDLNEVKQLVEKFKNGEFCQEAVCKTCLAMKGFRTDNIIYEP